jgi:glycerophosphoryl diester phosphodiesterase
MLILGHRGCAGHPRLSQNSEAAFAEALDAADGFESDAVLSKDGTVFLIHSNSKDGSIAEHLDAPSAASIGMHRPDSLTDAEITPLHLSHGENLPTLRRALEMVGQRSGKVLNIELKNFGVGESVLALLKDVFSHRVIRPEQVFVSSFDHAALAIFRHQMPGLKLGALCVSDTHHGQEIFPWAPYKVRYMGLKEAVSSRTLRELRPDYFIMPEKMLTLSSTDLIDSAYPHAKLCGWTVSEETGHDLGDLLNRLAALFEKMGAVIADDPRGFVQKMRNG